MRTLALLITLAACDERRVSEPSPQYRRRCSNLVCSDVFQLEYPDAGVTCWVVAGEGGISCLPTGGTADSIRALLDAELERTMGSVPRAERQRVTPGRRRRVRCH